MRHHPVFGFAITVALLMVAPAFAANVDTYGIGAEATAMGGAYTAYADGLAALHYNPAGLTNVEGAWVAIGSQFVNPQLDVSVEDPSGRDTTATGTTRDESPNLIVPLLGFSFRPAGSKLAFGFGAYVPFGLHLEWDKENSPTRYSVYESWIQRLAYGPAVAFQVTEQFSLGLTLLAGRSEFGEKKYFRTYAEGYGYQDLAHFEIEGEDSSDFSANLGLLFKANEQFSVGLAYRSQADVEFEGEIDVEYTQFAMLLAQMYGISLPASQKTKMKMKDFAWPQQLQAGIAFKPVDALAVTFDVTWTEWSVVQTSTPELDGIFYLYLFRPDVEDKSRLVVNRKWDDTLQIRVGGEYTIAEHFALRAGYFHDPSPIKDKYFDVSWPDADKHVFSVGGGTQFGSLEVNAAYQYAYIPEARDIGPDESENLMLAYPGERLVGETSSNVQNVVLTLAYGF